MKFIADGMLGKLARWLRLAGHDVIYVRDLKTSAETEDETMIEIARTKRRVLLTSDVELYKRAKGAGVGSFLLKSNDVLSQLVEIFKTGGQRIDMNPEKSRCTVCNGLLKEAAAQEVFESVPEKVIKRHEKFWRCVDCGKVYWPGKHWKTIIEMASEYNKMVDENVVS